MEGRRQVCLWEDEKDVRKPCISCVDLCGTDFIVML